MRVSTNMIYDQGVIALQTQSAALLYTGQQIATGRKILTPADDPVASARALDVTQSKQRQQAVHHQPGLRRGCAQAGRGPARRRRRDHPVRARAGARCRQSGAVARRPQSIATDLRSQFDAMLAIANTRDANGDYLFAGYRSNTPPFEKTDLAGTPGTEYKGDQGSRTMQVSSSRFMPVSFGGERVFGSGATTACSRCWAISSLRSRRERRAAVP
jgi:flagellar hook-associated protein 3 FlgL